jgi:hypothetical protein
VDIDARCRRSHLSCRDDAGNDHAVSDLDRVRPAWCRLPGRPSSACWGVPENQDTTNKVLRALAASVVLVSAYMVVLGPSLVMALGHTGKKHDRWVVVHPREAGLLVGLLIFAIPASAAFGVAARWAGAAKVANLKDRGPLGQPRVSQWWIASLVNASLAALAVRASGKAGIRYDPTPTAWDWSVDHAATFQGFVRVKTKDGQWQGGVFGEGSYFSSYPEPPGVFVEQAWQLDENGTFLAEQDLSRGAWIPCQEAMTVEFTNLGPGSEATLEVE